MSNNKRLEESRKRAVAEDNREIKQMARLIQARVGDARVDDIAITLTKHDLRVEVQCEWELETIDLTHGWKIARALGQKRYKYALGYQKKVLELVKKEQREQNKKYWRKNRRRRWK